MDEKRKIITEQDVRFVIAIIVFLVPIVACYYGIKQDLALIKQDVTTIKTNELVHLKDSITKMEERNSFADERQNEMQNQITRVLTILNK